MQTGLVCYENRIFKEKGGDNYSMILLPNVPNGPSSFEASLKSKSLRSPHIKKKGGESEKPSSQPTDRRREPIFPQAAYRITCIAHRFQRNTRDVRGFKERTNKRVHVPCANKWGE